MTSTIAASLFSILPFVLAPGNPPGGAAGLLPGGQTVETRATSLPIHCKSRLGGVTSDLDGNVYISNFDRQVWRVAPDGKTTLLAEDIHGASGNTMFGDDLLQASFQGNRILRFAPDGTRSVFASTDLNGPVGMAVDLHGDVFVCNCQGNSITRIALDGSTQVIASGGELSCPNGIALGPEDRPYVVNYNDGKVLRLTESGELELVATLPGHGNAHLAWAQGAFYVTKLQDNKIYRMTAEGEFEWFAGSGMPSLSDGPLREAGLNAPNGIAALPGGTGLAFNCLKGVWKSQLPAELVLRSIEMTATLEQPAVPKGASGLESIQLEVGGFRFDGLAAGPADGELVVLLHGFPQTGYSYRAQLRALAQAGFRAVAPDQRGYSPGARPVEVAQYTLPRLAADVVGFADALDRETFHLVGHDWGAAVAWLAAGLYPDRVQSLSVLSTPHYAAFGAQLADPDSEQSSRSSYMAGLAAEDGAANLLADGAAGLRGILRGGGISAEDVQVYVDTLGSVEAMNGALNWYRAMGLAGGGGALDAPRSTAPLVEVPTLYLWGDRDFAFARECAEASREFVSGTYLFEVLDGAGHWLPEEAAERVNGFLLDHLQATSGNGR